MPQALIPVIVKLGVSKLIATIAAYAITTAAAYFVSGLLQGGPPKPDASETTVKSPKPPRIHVLGKRRVYWSAMLYTNTTDSETVDVGAHCEGPINAVVQVYLNDDKVTISGGFVQALSDGSYASNRLLAGYNLGPNPNAAHAPVVSRVSSWTSNHRGDGIVSSYLIKTGVKSKDFLDIYPQGDNVSMSLVVEGHFVHDPRDPSSDPEDPSTWPYSDNAALLYLWFKTVFMGNDYATKIAPVEQYWIDAADDCDVAMTLAVGGTEPKYRGAIMFPADGDPVQIDDMIRATFDGWSAVDENGCIRVYSGKLYTPTVNVGSNQIIDYELQEFVEDENRLNEILVRYVSEDHDFNEPECEPWRDEADMLARGKTISTTANFQSPSHTQNRRLAKRQMARNNAPQRGRVRTVFSAREALAERYINLTIEDAGTTFFDGVAEVIGGERDSETGGAIIEWVAVDVNVDTWNPATEDGDPAPTAAKYYLPPLTAPTIDTATAQIDGSGAFARVAIEFDAITETAPTWFVRWRISGETSYAEQEIEPSGVTLLTGAVPVDETIDVGIAYSSGGRFSGWSADSTVDTVSTADAPAILSGSASAASGTGAVNPALPASYEIGQPLLLVVESANEAVTAPAGWTLLVAQGVGVAAASDATRVSVFWKRAVDGEVAPTVADPGDHAVARIYSVIRASNLSNPFNITGQATAASGTVVSFPSVTTTVAKCLIIGFVANATDTATDQFSAPVNAGLASVAVRGGGQTSSGNGGGFGVFTGIMAAAGSTGSTTATLANASQQALVTIAIAPRA